MNNMKNYPQMMNKYKDSLLQQQIKLTEKKMTGTIQITRLQTARTAVGISNSDRRIENPTRLVQIVSRDVISSLQRSKVLFISLELSSRKWAGRKLKNHKVTNKWTIMWVLKNFYFPYIRKNEIKLSVQKKNPIR